MKTLLPVFALVLLLAGCAPRGDALVAYHGVDFASLDANARDQATRRIASATGLPLSQEPGHRPLSVMALDNGRSLVVAEGLRLALLAGGKVQWTAELPLSRPLLSPTLSQLADQPVLSLGLGGKGRITQLEWALSSGGPILIGVLDNNQNSVAAHLGELGLPVSAGRIDGDAISRRAALVALAQPEAMARRSEPAIRSHLEALAAGTDVRLAQAAAAVLILPLR